MATAFDPYHRWLGIPPKYQPADFYRLLALERFEDDPEVIADAVERQIAHVRRYAIGPHSDMSQKILNELASAKVCLLNPDKKGEYDRGLRESMEASQDAASRDVVPSAMTELEPLAPVAVAPHLPAMIPSQTGRPSSVLSPRRSAGRRSLANWARSSADINDDSISRTIRKGAIGGGLLALILFAVWTVFSRDREGPVADVALDMTTTVPPPVAEVEENAVTADDEEQVEPVRTGTVVATEKNEPVAKADEQVKPMSRSSGVEAEEAQPPPLAISPFDAPKAAEHQRRWAEHLGVEVEFTNSIGMRFVLIPPGEFMMGSSEVEVAKLLEEAKARNLPSWYIDRLPSEAPKHRVRITKPFWLGVHEVTRGQFRRFVDDRKYRTEGERDRKGGSGLVDGQWKLDPRFVWNADLGFPQGDDHPVVNVTWNDVTAFCQWLSEKEGEKSCLPSEAQWEYACRAGTTTRWYSGDDEEALKEHAWFSFNAKKKTHPVGQKSPNAWGVCDLHGNVWEWCRDWFGDGYYATSPLDDPVGPAGGSYRVHRGGSWGSDASDCRASHRRGIVSGFRGNSLGFRLARAVSLPSQSR